MITWELFKTTVRERFIFTEMRETKVEDFFNLKHGSLTLREYSLNFVKFCRYATSVLSNNRDEMSRLMRGIAEDLEEECRQL